MNYLQQSDCAKNTALMVYPPVGNASFGSFDPFWISLTENRGAQEVVSAGPEPLVLGYDSMGRAVGTRTLTQGIPKTLAPNPLYTVLKGSYPTLNPSYPGVTGNPAYATSYTDLKGQLIPTEDLATYTGLASPNIPANRVRWAGTRRSSGTQVDAAGRVGLFLNGFDSPSEFDPGAVRPFGPNLALERNGMESTPVYAGSGSAQALHVRAKLHIHTCYAFPAAGPTPGAGGQIGWRGQFSRYDGADILPGVKYIVVLAHMLETRALGDPGVDGEDIPATITQNELWCSGTITAGKTSAYVTNIGDSCLFGRSTPRDGNFHWKITRANMVNILTGMGVSGTTPEDLRITGTTFNVEIYDNRSGIERTQFKPVLVGCYFEGQTVSIE